MNQNVKSNHEHTEDDSLITTYYDRASFQFQEVINTFEKLTGLKVCILFRTHYEKKPTYKAKIFLERIGHLNDFCSIIKSSPRLKGCQAYDGIQRARKAQLLRRPFVDECPAGVVELIVPLLIRGEFAGTIFCGQVRKYSNQDRGFEYIWDRVSFRGCDYCKLKSAYENFVFFPDAELIKLGNFFFYALSHVVNSLDDVVIERATKLQHNPLIRKAVEMLQNSPNGFPTAEEIAQQLGITLQYFSKLFKKVMNQSFIEYLIELKIARAQELLTNTDLPIIDIAGEVGYERQSYFTKKFRELTGITPRQFRASTSLLVNNR